MSNNYNSLSKSTHSTVVVKTNSSLMVNTKDYSYSPDSKGEGNDKVLILETRNTLRINMVEEPQEEKVDPHSRVFFNVNLPSGCFVNVKDGTTSEDVAIANGILNVRGSEGTSDSVYGDVSSGETRDRILASLFVNRKDSLSVPIEHVETISRIITPKNNPTLMVLKRVPSENKETIIKTEQIKIEPSTMTTKGIDSFSVELIAGRRSHIRLKEVDSTIKIKSVSTIPSSLYFDPVDSTIKGIPFIIGTHEVTVEMEDGMKVFLRIKVIPDDLSIVI
jgi:hypothetical protein